MKIRIHLALACTIPLVLLLTTWAQEINSELNGAQALMTARKYKEASDAFTKIISHAPDSIAAYEGRAQARVNLKDYAGAITDCARAIELNPNGWALYNLRGVARQDAGDSKGAIADYSRSIELNPRYAPPLAYRGMLRAKAGDAEGAMADYNSALAIAPTNEYALLRRAQLKASKGDNKGALADCTTLIGVNPKNANAHFNRGLALEKLGDRIAALAEFQKTLGLNPAMAAAQAHASALKASVGMAAAAALEPALTQAAGTKTAPATAPAGGRRGTAAVQTTAATATPHGSVPQAPAGMAAAAALGSTPMRTAPATYPAPRAATVGQAPAAAAQASAKPAAGPVQAFAPQVGSRVLTPFPGYAVADPCTKSAALPGAPWRADSVSAGGAFGSAQLGQYQALLRHTMQGLRVLYGQLTPVEQKNFDAFWAPFFDHPTAEALAYFKQIAPLLDDMAVTLSNIDGLLPGMGEALQTTMLDGADPASGQAPIAAIQYKRMKAERAHLDDLSKKVAALGNPPNPLAAKCAARARHRKAVTKEEDILALLKKAHLLNYEGYKAPELVGESIDQYAARRGPQDIFGANVEWSWEGNTITCAAETRYDERGLPTATLNRVRWEVKATVSADGKTIERLTGRTIIRLYDTHTGKLLPPKLDEDSEIINLPLESVTVKPGWAEITYALRGAAISQAFVRMKSDWVGKPTTKNEITVTFQVGDKPDAQQGTTQAATVAANVPGTSSGAAAATPAKNTPPPAGAKAQPDTAVASPTADPESDPNVNAEAIAEHLALADQSRAKAARWAADAEKEKNETTRQELQRLAAGSYATAQSEQDIAEGLRTGTMVHTDTDWDNQQHQVIVGKIKNELAVFSAENRLIADIPKVADLVGGVEGSLLREQMQDKVSDAIHSPDALAKLVAIYGEVHDDVVNRGQQEITYAQDRVNMWEHRLAVAQEVEMAAGMSITVGAVWAPVEMGNLALGYAGATGFAEGGFKGAAVAIIRSVSTRADAIISAYEGATKIDPVTHQPGGAWGAAEGFLWSIATNKAMERIGGQVQQAKAEYAAAKRAANAQVALAQQAAGGLGYAPVSRAGETKLTEFDFQTPEQRYKTELTAAKTPEEQAGVREKYAIQEKREAMGAEKEAALRRADDAVRQGTKQDAAREQYSQELKAIDEKYAQTETRNTEHQEVMKELGFDQRYSGENTDIKPTGSKPTTAESDMDFAPVGTPKEAVVEREAAKNRADEAVRQGADPEAVKQQYDQDLKTIDQRYATEIYHDAYQKGKAYTQALKKRGHNIDEYGDRWVDTTNDATIWKPGFSTEKPGNSSFAAEVIFGTLPNSDKFGTKGGIEWTSTGDTPDPLGAVLANAGKAVGAGLGNSRPPDLHVIGKSASKAIEILAQQKIPMEVDPKLQSQIIALRKHQTPEQAGIVDLGADPATKEKQIKAFLGKVQTLMGQAIGLAKGKSDAWALEQNQKAAAATPEQAYKIRSNVQTYQAGDKAAMETVAQVSPGLAAAMGQSVKPAEPIPSGPSIALNLGGLARELASDCDSDLKAPPAPADSSGPAFSGLGKRCQQAAQNAAIKLAAAKPGSDEAKYLADLKSALDQGVKNPAEAVRTVRTLSGTELAVVLAQLGAPAK